MEILRQEIFAPVLPIRIIDYLDEAVALANDCEYGPTSSIYTRDLSTAMKAAAELNVGETSINRENFEAMQGFHAGMRKSGIGGADGKQGPYEPPIPMRCICRAEEPTRHQAPAPSGDRRPTVIGTIGLPQPA